MRIRRNACVVVDGYSTGTALARVFAAYGVASIHVRSAAYLPEVLTRSFRAQDYAEVLDYDGDLEHLRQQVTGDGRRVLCVVAGAESGVILADALAERLGCPGNGTALSAARRDKSLMSAAVAAAGLATIPQLRSGDPGAVLRWIGEHGFRETILKPPASSGTYGFHICDEPAAVTGTLGKLLGSPDIFGTVIDEVIVQPYLRGEEFCVNAVSMGGSHVVTDVWLTRKRRCGPANVYDLETLLRPDDPRWPVLTGYVSRVLDALGIRYGPTHTEVMLTDGGPVLIESAARLMGSVDMSLVAATTGTNAVLLTAAAHLCPQEFARRASEPPALPTAYPAMVQMLARERGKLDRYCLDELTRLASFHGVDTSLQPGDEVVPTVNSYTSPGLIFLCAQSAAQLDADYRRIRELERQGALCLLSYCCWPR